LQLCKDEQEDEQTYEVIFPSQTNLLGQHTLMD